MSNSLTEYNINGERVCKACFDVYEINEGFTLSELRDEIGLGANNHVVAKRATKADFIISGIQWVKENDNSEEEKTISKRDIKNWLDSIPHSFSNFQKTDIINKIFDKSSARKKWRKDYRGTKPYF